MWFGMATQLLEPTCIHQTVETFWIAIGSNNNLFEIIARKLGGAVSRQSDRCFPRTRFGTNGNVLITTMK